MMILLFLCLFWEDVVLLSSCNDGDEDLTSLYRNNLVMISSASVKKKEILTFLSARPSYEDRIANLKFDMTFQTIALFGANGQIGECILRALLQSKKLFSIIAVIPPGTAAPQEVEEAKTVTIKEIDLFEASREELGEALKSVEVVISALNGKALEAQYTIQDAAADAGVQRFYPSEYGFHHIYRKPGDGWGYIHPVSLSDLQAKES
jgi:hypothetical protein